MADLKPFKPSDVVLDRWLIGTFGHAEMEFMAILLVRGCAFYGDHWQMLTRRQLKTVLESDIAGKVKPVCDLVGNPFAHPDLDELIQHGFACRGVTESFEGGVELTPAGISRLAKWVKQGKEEATND
jgi:hypothetical protein